MPSTRARQPKVFRLHAKSRRAHRMLRRSPENEHLGIVALGDPDEFPALGLTGADDRLDYFFNVMVL
jgi:hypothetical protein